MILYNDDDDTEDEEEFENMVLFYEYISSRRYVNERVPIPKSLEFCNAIFNYPDEDEEEDDEPEIQEQNFGVFHGFNLRQRVQSRLLDWYNNIHYDNYA